MRDSFASPFVRTLCQCRASAQDDTLEKLLSHI
jgi:hypothetical protein